jgi:hypothetical protein
MKRKLLLVIILHTSFYSFGQFSFGLKAGLNVNTFAFKDIPSNTFGDVKNSIGFHVGFYSSLDLGKKFFLIPELQFSQRGARYGNSNMNLNYIELPILFSYQPVKIVNIDLGPNFGYKVSDNLKYGYDKSFDVGITGGLRVNFSKRMSFIGRYYYGLSSIDEVTFTTGPDPNDITGVGKQYNRTFQIGLSYRIK